MVICHEGLAIKFNAYRAGADESEVAGTTLVPTDARCIDSTYRDVVPALVEPQALKHWLIIFGTPLILAAIGPEDLKRLLGFAV